MSVTDDIDKARVLASSFIRNGHKNVEILVIEPSCSDWNYGTQLIWDASELIEAFGLEQKSYNNREFLIECNIPKGSIVRRLKIS